MKTRERGRGEARRRKEKRNGKREIEQREVRRASMHHERKMKRRDNKRNGLKKP